MNKMVQDSYIELFKGQRNVIQSLSSVVLDSCRDAACDALKDASFSSYESELLYDFGINVRRVASNQNPYSMHACDIPNIGAYLFYVLNDTFYPNPNQPVLPSGVVICSLADAAHNYPELVSKYYGKQIDLSDANQALNLMFAQDGMFVYIPDGVVLDKPIQLINLMSCDSDIMGISHNLIIIGKNASAQVLVCDHTSGNAKYLANRVTEVFALDGAIYDHYKVENSNGDFTNLSTLLFELKYNSQVLGNLITLNNIRSRNTVSSAVDGQNCSFNLYGLALGDSNQEIHNITNIHHIQPNSSSTELYKYILDDQSKGKFYGLIKVDQDAQKTSAIQTNRNLIISKDSKMVTEPQLEIYADDVKCNHGSTVGQLDDSALFYLRSRGLSYDTARTLLMYAFVHDVIESIRLVSLKDRLMMLVENRLSGKENSCASCMVCK